MDERANEITNEGAKLRIWRRIAVKGVVFVVCIGILAVACAWFNAPLMTLLQRGIPDDKLGRVMGLFSALNGLTIPAGTALGGVIAEVTGTPLFFAIDGTFILLLAVSLALSKNVRKLDSIT